MVSESRIGSVISLLFPFLFFSPSFFLFFFPMDRGQSNQRKRKRQTIDHHHPKQQIAIASNNPLEIIQPIKINKIETHTRSEQTTQESSPGNQINQRKRGHILQSTSTSTSIQGAERSLEQVGDETEDGGQTGAGARGGARGTTGEDGSGGGGGGAGGVDAGGGRQGSRGGRKDGVLDGGLAGAGGSGAGAVYVVSCDPYWRGGGGVMFMTYHLLQWVMVEVIMGRVTV